MNRDRLIVNKILNTQKMLKQTFVNLIEKYISNQDLLDELWNELESNYSHKKRFYHSLDHLENILKSLLDIKTEIKNWDCILFTLFYHDIIYKAHKSNNEEKSAELAEKRMRQISVSIDMIKLCTEQILATKSHDSSNNIDTNYFTDADLSILGKGWESYETYYKNVRKEYSIYPDLVYNPGRRKVLNHFLSMDRIFKTEHFYAKYESNAKENLEKELTILGV
ncbi:MAG: putative metal-dependent HD superfamily phosphohydrolase [Flavobacteriales bacterium]|jgi:predicted metal-dependent HD superfamily phosphohydrolase